MKKKTVVLVLFLVLLHFMATQTSCAGLETQSKIQKILRNIRIDKIQFNEKLKMYEIYVQGGLFYMTSDMKYMFVGQIFELPSGVNITQQAIDKMYAIKFQDIPLSNTIKITDGPRKIVVFDDPECPFCRKLHPVLKKLDGKVAVYVFLYPLTRIHPDARKKSIAIWCSKDPVSALDRNFTSGLDSLTIPAGCKHPIDENIASGKKYRINGTPTIITDNNKILRGFVDEKTILNTLGIDTE